MRGHLLQIVGLVGRAAPYFALAALHGQGIGVHAHQGGVAAEHELHLFGGDGPAGHFVQGLQGFERLGGAGLGAFDAELLEPVRHLHLQGRFNGADVGIHRAAQVGHAGVVRRCKGVAQNHVMQWFENSRSDDASIVAGTPAPSSAA